MHKWIGIGLLCLVMPIVVCRDGSAGIKRHLVIYGGLSETDIPTVAKHTDILILDNVARDQLIRLKRINPQILVFQYHHIPGFHSHYSGWEQVNSREDWFAHDRLTDERLVEKKYGWYLMNLASESWRQYLAARIAKTTGDMFDGVFLDDVWPRFNNKFRGRDSSADARPPENIVSGWVDQMKQVITEVRRRYPKRIFINGASEEFLAFVDGCMEEGFVHPIWKPETKLPDPSTYRRMLSKMEKIKTFGKMLLVQSGTSGADPAAVEKLFEFCLASYYLIAGPNTSFGFHHAPTYRYLGSQFLGNPYTDIGEPVSSYRVVKAPWYPPNLITNGNFGLGWKNWQVLQGRPQIEPRTSSGTAAMYFESRRNGSDRIAGSFLPVRENTRYRLAAVCKSMINRPGSYRHEKLGLQGRFYTKDQKQLAGAYDLQFDEGTYDWLPFETDFASPAGAAFFRLRIGFIGGGTGKGWVSQLYFGPAADTAIVLGRTFTRAEVLLNSGTAQMTIHSTSEGPASAAPRILQPGEVIVNPLHKETTGKRELP